ncbi:MAG: beta-ketoacyl-[acyl-carrier-protein] synthase family protein, partial [Candidatus Margulisiibacteriota bacterium]
MNSKNKRVVITGIGVLSPNGIGKDVFWSSCVNGVSGISPIEGFNTSKSDYKIGGEIKKFSPEQFIPKDVAKRADRFAQLGLVATDMAISDSGLDIKNLNADRIGVSIGSGAGGLLFHEQEMMAIVKGIHQEAHPFSIPKVSPNAIASWIAIVYGIKGPNISITTACASGAHGIGQGLDMIRLGKADVVLAGGAEAPLTPFSFSAFSSMRVMSKSNEEPQKVMKPFDRKRDGFIMGEGSGILILEDLNHALKRKTKIYAELIGYGMSNGCYHMVIPSPDGEDYIRAMKMAIKDAGISPNKI